MPDSDKNDGQGFMNIDEMIRSEMYRFDCPSPLELGEYHLDLLLDTSKKEIEDHLKSCPHCREELKYVKEFVKTPSAFETGKTGFKKDTIPPVVIPFKQEIIYHDTAIPLEAVRSDGTWYENRKITIKLDKDQSLVMFYALDHEEGHYILKGQFVPDIRMEKRITGALVEIWQENKIRTTAIVDDLYAFAVRLKKRTPIIIRVSNEQGSLLSIKLDLK